MKYLKTFELTDSEKHDIRVDATESNRKFKVGDYVRHRYDNEVYIVDDVDEYSHSLPYYLTGLDGDIFNKDGGWFGDKDGFEKLEDWEIAAIKYNL
jgi:hypothetical protein